MSTAPVTTPAPGTGFHFHRHDNTGALAAFMAYAQGVIDTHYAVSYPTLSVPKLEITVGRRYAKVMRRETRMVDGVRTVIPESGSYHCFVDMATGCVLKSSGGKPAKGSRGNIFGNYLNSVSASGAARFR